MVAGIKAKTYRGNLRRILAEAMLGAGVICVEGISDAEVLSSASYALEESYDSGAYTPLDQSSVTIVQCEGDGGMLRYGEFFKILGKRVYAFYEKQAINREIWRATWPQIRGRKLIGVSVHLGDVGFLDARPGDLIAQLARPR